MAEGLIWGRRDCATEVAAHVRARTGVDVMDPWRGLYGCARSAARLQAAEGGLIAMTDAAMALAGWSRGGDEIAALGRPGGVALAVRNGDWWRVPGAEGPVHVRRDAVRPLATWGPV